MEQPCILHSCEGWMELDQMDGGFFALLESRNLDLMISKNGPKEV